jgi:hypothetical protein
MSGFEDTRLLRHPTVERAYNEMRKFFLEGEDFASEACRAGEIITARAKNPDPDAIAASVLMDGMIVRYQASSFAATVSPRAAEIIENMYNFDPEAPKFPGTAEQQIVLAHSIMGLESVEKKIKSGELYSTMDYEEVQQALKLNEKCLLTVIEGHSEGGMAAAAVESLLVAKSLLEDYVRQSQAKLVFEKSGLPDHPLVREVYEYMKDKNLKGHPLGGYTDTNAAIARTIYETGASSDPEILCAALLNQYGKSEGKSPGEFSPRIGELWKESSGWAWGEDKKEPTAEGNIIRHAFHLNIIEEELAGLAKWKREGREMNPYALERLEDSKKRIDKALEERKSPAYVVRMEKARAEAKRIMHEPENVKIRKPGSPRIDAGW